MKTIKSVPLVLQYEAVECGAASLLILRSHGKFMPLVKFELAAQLQEMVVT